MRGALAPPPKQLATASSRRLLDALQSQLALLSELVRSQLQLLSALLVNRQALAVDCVCCVFMQVVMRHPPAHTCAQLPTATQISCRTCTMLHLPCLQRVPRQPPPKSTATHASLPRIYKQQHKAFAAPARCSTCRPCRCRGRSRPAPRAGRSCEGGCGAGRCILSMQPGRAHACSSQRGQAARCPRGSPLHTACTACKAHTALCTARTARPSPAVRVDTHRHPGALRGPQHPVAHVVAGAAGGRHSTRQAARLQSV